MDKKETKEELFRKLFTTFYDRLYGFALSRVLCRDAAADITNEVFCRLWEQFDRLDFSTSPLPLLYTMTRNRGSDLLRQKTARPTGSDTDAEEQWRQVSSRTLGRQDPVPRRARTVRWPTVTAAAAVAILLIFIWSRYLQQPASALLALSKKTGKVVDHQPADPNHVIVVKAVNTVPPVLITDSHGHKHVLIASSISYTAAAAEVPPEQIVLSTQRGKSVKVTLNDSTEVWINGEGG